MRDETPGAGCAAHTAAEWGNVINRMHLRSQGRGTVVKVPSEEELRTIVGYVKQHAR